MAWTDFVNDPAHCRLFARTRPGLAAIALAVLAWFAASSAGFAKSAIVYRQNDAFSTALAAYERRDFKTAHDHWLPLARTDDLAAQRNIGHLYLNGLGVRQDFSEALKWYLKAAERGLVGAQVNLADMYDRGQGTPRDVERAIDWFLQAARQGDAVAQFRLGTKFARGDGVKLDRKTAAEWYRLAARSGYEPAARHLRRLQEKSR